MDSTLHITPTPHHAQIATTALHDWRTSQKPSSSHPHIVHLPFYQRQHCRRCPTRGLYTESPSYFGLIASTLIGLLGRPLSTACNLPQSSQRRGQSSPGQIPLPTATSLSKTSLLSHRKRGSPTASKSTTPIVNTTQQANLTVRVSGPLQTYLSRHSASKDQPKDRSTALHLLHHTQTRC